MNNPQDKRKRILGGVFYFIGLLAIGAIIAFGADSAKGEERKSSPPPTPEEMWELKQ